MPMDNEDQPPSPRLRRLKNTFNNIYSRAFSKTPHSRSELMDVPNRSQVDGILDEEALDTIDRILDVADLRVRDIMIPRSQAILLNNDYTLEQCLEVLIQSSHSRFPVLDPDDDEITGILLTKDILRFFDAQERKRFNLHDLLWSAVFIPESKPSDAA